MGFIREICVHPCPKQGDFCGIAKICRIPWLVLLLLLLGGCRQIIAEIPVAPSTPETFSQWAARAQASSQYGLPDWSANRALGPPAVDACADDARAWASARGNGVEWLHLTYAQPMRVAEVRIHQTFGVGAISRVSLVDVEGNLHPVWEGTDTTTPCPGVLLIAFPLTEFRAEGVRIDLDESRTGFWNQIDAVELFGTR